MTLNNDILAMEQRLLKQIVSAHEMPKKELEERKEPYQKSILRPAYVFEEKKEEKYDDRVL